MSLTETSLWSRLGRPILALAPLHEVTDAAFRETLLGERRRLREGC